MGKRSKRNYRGQFLAIPMAVAQSEEYIGLSHKARSLLIDLLVQLRFKGNAPINNGDFQATWFFLQPRGWASKDTIYRALQELIDARLVIKTRQGGRNQCSLFAVSWLPINECNGKLDHGKGPTTAAPVNWYPSATAKVVTRSSGQPCPDHRANEGGV